LIIHQLRLLLHNFLQERLVSKYQFKKPPQEIEENVEGEEEETMPIKKPKEKEAPAYYVPPSAPHTIGIIHRESNDKTITCSEEKLSGKLFCFSFLCCLAIVCCIMLPLFRLVFCFVF
jgi:hypothetical protein